MRYHLCHVKGCQIRVPPELLMCREHWAKVPPAIRRAVLRHYTPGQCRDWSKIKAAWVVAARTAINHVESISSCPDTPKERDALASAS